VRASREDVSTLLSDDFVEFASSGQVYDKATIVELLAADPSSNALELGIEDFSVRFPVPSIALVTYRSKTRGRLSLRASLWQESGGRWRMLFHQGTLT
jgi:hypothetical protein